MSVDVVGSTGVPSHRPNAGAVVHQLRPRDRGQKGLGSAGAAVADVRGQRRMQHLDGLQPEGFDAVEDPLA